jgi:hypothetical protein
MEEALPEPMISIRTNLRPLWHAPIVSEKLTKKYRRASPEYNPYGYPSTDERRAYMKAYMRRRRLSRGLDECSISFNLLAT